MEQQFEDLWRDGLVEINLDLQVRLTRKGEEFSRPLKKEMSILIRGGYPRGGTHPPGDAGPSSHEPREGSG